MSDLAMTMTDTPTMTRQPTDWASHKMQSRIRRRYRSEAIFRNVGLGALVLAAAFLVFLLVDVVGKGWTGFLRTEAQVTVHYDPAALMIDPKVAVSPNGKQALMAADYQTLTAETAEKTLGEGMLSEGAWLTVRDHLVANPGDLGKSVKLWLPTSSTVDLLAKGLIDRSVPEEQRPVNNAELANFDRVQAANLLRTGFNKTFVTSADSTEPELAGVWGAALGSLLTLVITLSISFPVGVLAAIYLEEYAPKNRLTDLIEVSINNLAAVPSIIFGLLGLAVFLNSFGLPRSAPLVGGLTLALMTLPVIVIAARVSIKAVPPSIRDAALGIGASRVQVVFHHVLPLALPGILTGTIIGMARALGETAPLLMIGMRAFISDVPTGISNPATVLPVQIFLWSDDVARGFVEKTSAAIMVLLVFLLLMNAAAVYLRNKFERRW